MTNGAVLWQGRSWYNDMPIMAIASSMKRGENKKTGNVTQVYIMHSDMNPRDAIKAGCDSAVCGNCSMRMKDDIRLCYVCIFRGPRIVWKRAKSGVYPKIDNYPQGWTHFETRKIRLGTYGDPAFLPETLVHKIIGNCQGYTGYTHQWKDSRASHLRDICMASCDNLEDAILAEAQGWKVFLVKPQSVPDQVVKDALYRKVVHCPGSNERGKIMQCSKYELCNGRKRHVVVNAHGKVARKRFTW